MADHSLNELQTRLKKEFISQRGYWTESWETVLETIPEHFEAYINMSGLPYRCGTLPLKTKDLISIAISSTMTHLHEPSLRGHIKNALRHSATKAEILATFGISAVLGIHSMSFSLPIILGELERMGKPIDLVNLSPRAKEVKAEWEKKRGYWPRNFTSMLALDPDFVAAYSQYGDALRINGPLDRKTIELICVAVDGSGTHLFAEGVRVHSIAALEHGATMDEIMETLELTTALGMHTMTFGVPILLEEIAQSEGHQA